MAELLLLPPSSPLFSSCVRRRSWTFRRSLSQGAFFSGEAPEEEEEELFPLFEGESGSTEEGLGGTGFSWATPLMFDDRLLLMLLFMAELLL